MSELSTNKVNSYSLFHYTKRLETLRLILKNGIRFSYAYEYYSLSSIGTKDLNKGVAIPMVSFCDIPINNSSKHREEYGHYMIGLDKSFLINYSGGIWNLNPVFYILSSNIQDAFLDLSNVYRESNNENNGIPSQDVITLALRRLNIKKIYGLIKPIGNEKNPYKFYDEREWRAFLLDNPEQPNAWHWDICLEEYEQMKEEWNNILSDKELAYNNYIDLPCEDYLRLAITHIVVKEDKEVDETKEFILNSQTLFGCRNVSFETRHYLISKISSFKRIALDY